MKNKLFSTIGTFMLAAVFFLVSCNPVGAQAKVVLVGGGSPYKNLSEFATMDQVLSIGTGSIFYVDSGLTASGLGTSWGSAVITLDEAVALCTANNGDVILVAPGHAETIAAADGVDIDVAGVTVVGIGEGEDMPEFTFSATGSEFVIGAANVTVKNLRFIAGVSSIVMGISVEAAGDNFTLKDCVFPKPTTNSWEFLDAIDVADGANNIRVESCEYYNDEGGAAPNHFIEAGNGTAGPEKLQVIDCYIKGDFAVSAIWSDEPCDEALIVGNTIINHTTGQHCVEFTDTGTGAIINNNLYGDTEGAILDPGSMYIAGNNICTAIDLDGIPRWVVDNGLNHLTALDGATQKYPENAVNDSILAKLMTKADPAVMADYDNSTDSLQAIADALAVADGNVDTIEEVAFTAESPNYLAVTADMSSATWNTAAAHEIVTVTGNVRVRILCECTVTLEDAGDTATLILGIAGNTAAFLASTSAGGAGAANQLDAGEIWIDATPADLGTALITSAAGGAIIDAVVVGGYDIGYTIGTEALTAGTLIFHVWWSPLSATGACVAGAGGVL